MIRITSPIVTKKTIGLGNVTNDEQIPLTQKGANNGVAELDGAGKVPSGQLPSYVDDVLEYADFASLPATGTTGIIYVTLDDNKTYRWTGSAYVEISASLVLGETSETAYRGDRGKTAYDHSQAAHAPSDAQKNSDILKSEIEAKLTGTIDTHTHDLEDIEDATNILSDMVDATAEAQSTAEDAQGTADDNADDISDLEGALGDYLPREASDTFHKITAFENQTDSVFNITIGTRTFEIAPAVTSWNMWSDSTKITKSSAESVVWSDVEGEHYIYYTAGGVLSHTTTFTDDFINGSLIFVASFHWDATNNELLLNSVLDERHQDMDPTVHKHFHDNFGLQITSGLALTDITTGGDGDTDAHAQFGVSGGKIADEDVIKSVSAITSTTGLPVIYLEGDNGGLGYLRNGSPTAGFSVLNASSGRVQYNEWTGTAWQLTEVTNNDFVIYHVVTSTFYDGTSQVFAMVGQNEYPNMTSARSAIATEAKNIQTSNLPFAEFHFVASIIVQTGNGKSNAVKASLESIDGNGQAYYDWTDKTLGSGNQSVTTTTADNVTVDSSGFNQNLNSTDITVQEHMETIDTLPIIRENFIDNGDMAVAQRGTASATMSNGQYFLDRFKARRNSVSPTASVGTSPTVTSTRSLVMTCEATESTVNAWDYSVENYNQFKGKTITLSCMMKSDNANARILIQDGVSMASSMHTGGGEWEKITITKDFSASANQGLFVFGLCNSSVNPVSVNDEDYFEIADVKLELGSIATSFIPDSPAIGLAKCQRYYTVKTQPIFLADYANSTQGTNGYGSANVTFPVPMESQPTVTLGTGTYVTSCLFIFISAGIATPVSFSLIDSQSVLFRYAKASLFALSMLCCANSSSVYCGSISFPSSSHS